MVTIGLGVVTYNRKDYLKQCLDSLEANNWGGATKRIVIDDCSTDGTDAILRCYGNLTYYIKNKNEGVGDSKNKALQWMHDEGCDYMFLMEDDITMIHPHTCIKYIAYCKARNIQHANFGLHGTANIGKGFYNYEGVFCYPECVGAFSYYTREVVDVVGLFDVNFLNVWEHVEHTYRIAQYGYTTPFWQFCDHPESATLLKEIPNSITNSVIRPRADWQKNINKGKEYWIKKHGKWLPPRR